MNPHFDGIERWVIMGNRLILKKGTRALESGFGLLSTTSVSSARQDRVVRFHLLCHRRIQQKALSWKKGTDFTRHQMLYFELPCFHNYDKKMTFM